MNHQSTTNENDLAAQIFALRTALMMLAACMSDRLAAGELRQRLQQCADEADMRGGELRFSETSKLLRMMAVNLVMPAATKSTD